jgi:hypothetical protein
MRSAPLFTSWLVQTRSPEESRALQRRLSEQIRLDTLVEDLVRTYPNGVEQRESRDHRLGDYFAEIRLLPADGPSASTFRMLFHRIPEAGRFWKDLMVNFVQQTEKAPETSAVSLDYKGDQDPTGNDHHEGSAAQVRDR